MSTLDPEQLAHAAMLNHDPSNAWDVVILRIWYRRLAAALAAHELGAAGRPRKASTLGGTVNSYGRSGLARIIWAGRRLGHAGRNHRLYAVPGRRQSRR